VWLYVEIGIEVRPLKFFEVAAIGGDKGEIPLFGRSRASSLTPKSAISSPA
jgi:hypothetical protein